MTFKKNLLTVLAVVIFVMIISYLVGMPREYMSYGASFLIAAGVLILATEDMLRKFFSEKEKLTWQYFIGFVIVLVAVAIFLWAVVATENNEFFLRLGLAVFSGGVGGWWFYSPYRKSLQNSEEKVSERWERAKKRLLKAKAPAKATKVLNENLRFYLAGDTVAGSIDLDRPLGVINENPLSYEEMLKSDVPEVEEMKRATSNYINNLVAKMEFTAPEVVEV